MTSTRRGQPPSLSELRSRRDAILEIARRHGVLGIRIFGSVARGDADSDSNIDLLVELEPGRSLFDLGGLLMDLRDFFGGPVDVVTSAALQERVHARVMREAVPLISRADVHPSVTSGPLPIARTAYSASERPGDSG